jgi:hypothetical protein
MKDHSDPHPKPEKFLLPRITEKKGLISNIDKRIILIGKKTTCPLQHLMGHFMNYPHTAYIDLSDGSQIGVYLKSKIDSYELVEITGKVVVLHAPGPEGTKSIADEYQLIAENWKYPL